MPVEVRRLIVRCVSAQMVFGDESVSRPCLSSNPPVQHETILVLSVSRRATTKRELSPVKWHPEGGSSAR